MRCDDVPLQLAEIYGGKKRLSARDFFPATICRTCSEVFSLVLPYEIRKSVGNRPKSLSE